MIGPQLRVTSFAGEDAGIFHWGGRRSKFWFRKNCWTFLWQITFPHTPLTSHWEGRDDYVFLNLWKQVAVGAGNTQITEGTQRQSHFLIFLEFSWVAKYNTRFIKKSSQLNSDIQSYCYRDFSIKQLSGLIGGGGVRTPRTIPLDPPLLWCALISFLQHSVIRTHQLQTIHARAELETQ